MNVQFRRSGLFIRLVCGLFIGILTLGAHAESSDGYSVLEQGVAHDRLFSIAFSGSFGIAVGDAGQVMISEDGGDSWAREKAPTDLALLGVAVNNGRAIVVGQKGLIFVRELEGDPDWQQVASGTEERLLQVAVNADGLAFVVGAFGTVLRSDDNGSSWSFGAPVWEEEAKAYLDGSEGAGSAILNPTLYAVNVRDDGSVLLAGEIGYVLYSSDRGESWTLARLGENDAGEIAPTIFDISLRDDGRGFAVGQSGLMLQSSDHGRSWNAIESPVDANLFSISSFGQKGVLVTGMRVALRSDDEAKTWTSLDQLDLETRWYSDVISSPSGSRSGLLAVGHSGRIITIPGS